MSFIPVPMTTCLEGYFLQVASETHTSAMPQHTTPMIVEPSFIGSPISFHTTQVTKPVSIPAMMPGEVAFLQKSAARQGRPMAAYEEHMQIFRELTSDHEDADVRIYSAVLHHMESSRDIALDLFGLM